MFGSSSNEDLLKSINQIKISMACLENKIERISASTQDINGRCTLNEMSIENLVTVIKNSVIGRTNEEDFLESYSDELQSLIDVLFSLIGYEYVSSCDPFGINSHIECDYKVVRVSNSNQTVLIRKKSLEKDS